MYLNPAQIPTTLMEPAMDAGQPPPCPYCRGVRAQCTCTEDCGARPDAYLNIGHTCPKAPAEVRAEWLRSTGLYSEEEIARETGDAKSAAPEGAAPPASAGPGSPATSAPTPP